MPSPPLQMHRKVDLFARPGLWCPGGVCWPLGAETPPQDHRTVCGFPGPLSRLSRGRLPGSSVPSPFPGP